VTEQDKLAVNGSVPERRIGYVPEFDGLRGLAAVFVVAVHLFMVVIPEEGQLPNEIPGTFVFMDFFFVLSGFLITSLLLRERSATGSIGLKGFYRRRALRLLPGLYLLLAIHTIYALILGPPDFPADVQRSTVIHAALYGVNFQMNNLFSPVARGLTQLWSLGVEEQFYLVWPLLVIVLLPARRSLRASLGILVAAIVLVATHRALLWEPELAKNTGWLRLYTHTDTRADSLLVGAVLAFLWTRGLVPSRRTNAVLATLAVPGLVWFLFFVKLYDSFPYLGGFTLMAVLWAFVVLACVESDWFLLPLLRIRLLRFLGVVSYGIYLWHVPVQFAVRDHWDDQHAAIRVLLSLILTAVMVTLSWKLVEKPFLRAKDRSGAPSTDAAAVSEPDAQASPS